MAKNTTTIRTPEETKKFFDEINRGYVQRLIDAKKKPKELSYCELMSKLPKVPGLKEFMIKEIKLR